MCKKCTAKQQHIEYLNFKYDVTVKHGKDTGAMVRFNGFDDYHEKMRSTELPILKLNARIKDDPELEELVKAYAFRAELLFSLFISDNQEFTQNVDFLLKAFEAAIQSMSNRQNDEDTPAHPS